jgi:DNA-binding GntR family transcriptional regulator
MTATRRPATAQEFVLAEVRSAILNRELLPGEPIRQDALAERLGVSRVPLREALKILEGEGQVVYRPRRGYLVAELSLDDLMEVYRIRRILEDEAARAALPNITSDHLVALTAIQREIEAASEVGDMIAMAQANRRFHFLFLEQCESPRLVRMIRLLWDTTDAYRSVYYGQQPNRVRVNREHRAILTAIGKRDTERVLRLLDEHRSHTVEALKAIIS